MVGVLIAGVGLFRDLFSQDFFPGQIPYDATMPGAAYNHIGPKPILSSGEVTNQIANGQPVFNCFAASSNLFAVDQHARTPRTLNYILNLQQQAGKSAVFPVGYVGKGNPFIGARRTAGNPPGS